MKSPPTSVRDFGLQSEGRSYHETSPHSAQHKVDDECLSQATTVLVSNVLYPGRKMAQLYDLARRTLEGLPDDEARAEVATVVALPRFRDNARQRRQILQFFYNGAIAEETIGAIVDLNETQIQDFCQQLDLAVREMAVGDAAPHDNEAISDLTSQAGSGRQSLMGSPMVHPSGNPEDDRSSAAVAQVPTRAAPAAQGDHHPHNQQDAGHAALTRRHGRVHDLTNAAAGAVAAGAAVAAGTGTAATAGAAAGPAAATAGTATAGTATAGTATATATASQQNGANNNAEEKKCFECLIM